MIGAEGDRRLVAATLISAVNDARLSILPLAGRGAHKRYLLKSRALAWLASSSATPWFDYAQVGQTRVLATDWWRAEARAVLAQEANDYHGLIRGALCRIERLV